MEDQEQQRYQWANARVQAIKGFYIHATIFVLVNLGLFVINWVTPGNWWFYWPLIGWGVGLAIHALVVFVFGGNGLEYASMNTPDSPKSEDSSSDTPESLHDQIAKFQAQVDARQKELAKFSEQAEQFDATVNQTFDHTLGLTRQNAAAWAQRAGGPEKLKRLEEAEAFARRAEEVAGTLLTQPLSDNTRQNQWRLLLASGVGLLLSQGLFYLEKVGVGSAELKASSPWSVVLAAALALVYFLTVFVFGYLRDKRVYSRPARRPCSVCSS